LGCLLSHASFVADLTRPVNNAIRSALLSCSERSNEAKRMGRQEVHSQRPDFLPWQLYANSRNNARHGFLFLCSAMHPKSMSRRKPTAELIPAKGESRNGLANRSNALAPIRVAVGGASGFLHPARRFVMRDQAYPQYIMCRPGPAGYG